MRADLQEVYGVDLAELFTKKRWVHLLALIDGLPTHSRYMAALLSDPEVAEQIVNHPDYDPTPKASPPSLTGYTQINYQLADISDGLKSLQATLVAVNGGKGKAPKPGLRPITAIEEAKKERSRRIVEDMQKTFFKT